MVTIKDLCNLGGENLLKIYNNSLSQLFAHLYPDFSWENGRFQETWDDLNFQRNFLDTAASN